MANLNRIILVGRLTADPETRATADGLPMAKFRLAVNRPAAGGTTATDFVDIVAWSRLAEICGQYLKKDRLVLVEGRIQNRSFEDGSGQRRWVTEVIANNMTMLERPTAAASKQEPVSFTEETVPDEEEPIEAGDLASDLPF